MIPSDMQRGSRDRAPDGAESADGEASLPCRLGLNYIYQIDLNSFVTLITPALLFHFDCT